MQVAQSKVYDSEDEEEFKEVIDFVNIQTDKVAAKLGSRYSKKDTEDFLIYDCKPEEKK
jgi:hypothetical protein